MLLLIVTLEYNYSIPGVLRNAIDWACRPHGDSAWSGKAAAIMGASLGAIGTARAQYHLRQILVALNLFTRISLRLHLESLREMVQKEKRQSECSEPHFE
jgi:NAD(P)H-dependent FMN reductase